MFYVLARGVVWFDCSAPRDGRIRNTRFTYGLIFLDAGLHTLDFSVCLSSIVGLFIFGLPNCSLPLPHPGTICDGALGVARDLEDCVKVLVPVACCPIIPVNACQP